MNDNLTSKQKLDQILGISDGKTVDDLLNEMDIDSSLSSAFSSIDSKVKDSLQHVDCQLSAIQLGQAPTALQLKDMESSMREVEDLIGMSKAMFKHVYQSIVTSSLIDSELLGAAGKLLESVHINIQEFISLYKDKQRFIEKLKFTVFQQEQKKEMMLFKHKLDMEKLQMKSGPEQVDADVVPFDIVQVTKALDAEVEQELDVADQIETKDEEASGEAS